MASGPDTAISVFAWTTELLNFYVGTPVFKAEYVSSQAVQLIGAAIAFFSMVIFWATFRKESPGIPQFKEGAINFNLPCPTPLHEVVEIIRISSKTPIKMVGFSNEMSRRNVKPGEQHFASVEAALRGICASLEGNDFVSVTVSLEQGIYVMTSENRRNAKV